MRRAVVAWSSGCTGGSGGCHRAGTRQTVVVVCLTCSGGTTVVVGPWRRRGTHVVVPAVTWYIAPSRSWTTHHSRTDIHGLVVVPMGIVAHTADISSATEGIIARRAIGYIETGAVGIHRVDSELNTISCPVQRTVEIVRVLIYLILIHGEHIAQIGVTTCPGSTEQIVVYSNRKHVVEIDLIHCFHLLRTKAKLVGHLIGEEQRFCTRLRVGYGLGRCNDCQHQCHHHHDSFHNRYILTVKHFSFSLQRNKKTFTQQRDFS